MLLTGLLSDSRLTVFGLIEESVAIVENFTGQFHRFFVKLKITVELSTLCTFGQWEVWADCEKWSPLPAVLQLDVVHCQLVSGS